MDLVNAIVFNLDKLKEDGFSHYLKGRSYDLQENNQDSNPELAVYNYKKGYYKYGNKLCQYSIAMSIKLGDFLDYFDDEDYQVEFPSLKEIEELAEGNSVEALYAKFILAAYYNYGLAGVEQDEEKAFQIIEECALSGHVGAMYDLGAKEKFIKKIGKEESTKWLNLAAINGSLRAKELLFPKEKTKK